MANDKPPRATDIPRFRIVAAAWCFFVASVAAFAPTLTSFERPQLVALFLVAGCTLLGVVVLGRLLGG